MRPIPPVSRSSSCGICSERSTERPEKVRGSSVGVDLVEYCSVDREVVLRDCRRRHGAMSHLHAPRCSSHCLCMIIMELRGRRAVPLDPHADLGRARACRCRFVGLRRTRLLARCVDVEQGGRGARDMGRDGREGQRRERHVVVRRPLRVDARVLCCLFLSSVLVRLSIRSIRSLDRIGSDRSDRIG